MTKEAIKDKLIDYEHQFKRISGHFKSFEVIYDYILFLNSEPYLKKIIKPLSSYVEKQFDLIREASNDPIKTKELNNICLDILDPSSLSNIPIFNKEMEIYRKSIENKEPPAFKTFLPFNLTSLMLVASEMQAIKDYQKAGDDEKANELIAQAQEESYSFMPTSYIKNYGGKAVLYSQFLASSIELINKHIIDKIDAQDFLNNHKPKATICFDKEKSILYIRGQKIKIARTKIKPIDHYILECIFSQEDIFDPADFSYISNNFLQKEYDTEKGWNTFRNACDKLNKKIDETINIKDFIEYSPSKLGWCKINKKYQ